ncbi:MAG: hypothetical protein HQL37_11360 [Alphaproteobacteria bacterium]|nr:hypothetical protein [Alphaproteobacteria bacterium]
MLSRKFSTVVLLAMSAALAGNPAQAKPFFIGEIGVMSADHHGGGPAAQATPTTMVKRMLPSSCCLMAEVPAQAPSATIK